MTIKYDEIERLLAIVPDHPAMNIFHLSDGHIELSKQLNDFAKNREYDYDLAIINEDFLNKCLSCGLKPHKLKINQSRYNRHSKIYDYIFITLNLDMIVDKKLFFTKIYHICKNASKVLIFLENGDHYELETLLEERNFLAANYIDISTEYRVYSLQKMHGWGSYDL